MANNNTDVKICCRDEDNLEIYEDPTVKPKSDLLIRRCKICKCRHFEVIAEPGIFGVELKSIG